MVGVLPLPGKQVRELLFEDLRREVERLFERVAGPVAGQEVVDLAVVKRGAEMAHCCLSSNSRASGVLEAILSGPVD